MTLETGQVGQREALTFTRNLRQFETGEPVILTQGEQRIKGRLFNGNIIVTLDRIFFLGENREVTNIITINDNE